MAMHLEPSEYLVAGKKVWVLLRRPWYSARIQHMYVTIDAEGSIHDVVRTVDPEDQTNRGYLVTGHLRTKILKLFHKRKYGWRDTLKLPRASVRE